MKFKIYHILIALIPAWLMAGSGCIKERAGTPAWLEIDSLDLNPAGTPATASSRFTDAWVYVNSNLVGGFELPARIPVLAEGNTNVIIFPGIYVNGLSALRSPYLKIKRFEQDLNFVPGQTIHLNHTFTLDTAVTYHYMENFDAGNGSSSLNPSFGNSGAYGTVTGPGGFGSGYYKLSLDAPENTIAQVENSQLLTLPKGDVGGLFLEMNYKCNTSFIVSLLAYPDDGGATQKIGVIGINPSEHWNKIYIALSPTVNGFTFGNKFRLAIGFSRQPDIPVQEVYLDNLQILY